MAASDEIIELGEVEIIDDDNPDSQPEVPTVVDIDDKPKDYLGWSIFTLFCCLPFGIAAILFSCTSRKAARRLDFVTAKEKAKEAKCTNITGLVFGLLTIILLIAMIILLTIGEDETTPITTTQITPRYYIPSRDNNLK